MCGVDVLICWCVEASMCWWAVVCRCRCTCIVCWCSFIWGSSITPLLLTMPCRALISLRNSVSIKYVSLIQFTVYVFMCSCVRWRVDVPIVGWFYVFVLWIDMLQDWCVDVSMCDVLIPLCWCLDLTVNVLIIDVCFASRKRKLRRDWSRIHPMGWWNDVFDVSTD